MSTASFPNSIVTWADKKDGIDDANAEDMNNAYAEIIATETMVKSHDSQLADKANYLKLSSSKDLKPSLINMHFGALRGTGWQQETPSLTQFPVTQESAKGTKTIYANNAIFISEQLICYTDKDGKYHSNVTKSVYSDHIDLMYPLDADIDTTCFVMVFYENYAHPNKYGFRAIADYAIDSMNKPNGILTHRISPQSYTILGTGVTLGNARNVNYQQPYGKSDVAFATITNANSGLSYGFEVEKAGLQKIVLNINTVFDDTIILFITKDTGESIYSKSLKNGTYSSNEEIFVNLEAGNYYIKISTLSTVSATAYVYLGITEIYYCENKYDISDLNKGTHLLLGDSWFENEGIYEQFLARLPEANIINFGVGGNNIDNLIRRFGGTATDADIKNNPSTYGSRKDATLLSKIDFVWIMCGTNDYYANTDAITFQAKLIQLINMVLAIGAKPILFNSSVGDLHKTATTYDILNLSRQYADFFLNLNQSVSAITQSVINAQKLADKSYIINFANISCVNGKSYLGCGGIVGSNQKVVIDEIYFDYASSKNIDVIYNTNLIGFDSPEKSTVISTAYSANIDFGSPTNSRWFEIIADNSTGGAVIYNGYVKLRVVTLS